MAPRIPRNAPRPTRPSGREDRSVPRRGQGWRQERENKPSSRQPQTPRPKPSAPPPSAAAEIVEAASPGMMAPVPSPRPMPRMGRAGAGLGAAGAIGALLSTLADPAGEGGQMFPPGDYRGQADPNMDPSMLANQIAQDRAQANMAPMPRPRPVRSNVEAALEEHQQNLSQFPSIEGEVMNVHDGEEEHDEAEAMTPIPRPRPEIEAEEPYIKSLPNMGGRYNSSMISAPREPASPTGPRQYVVQRGDSLWKIAERLYGDGRMWKQLVQEVPEMRDPNFIRPGQVINLRGGMV